MRLYHYWGLLLLSGIEQTATSRRIAEPTLWVVGLVLVSGVLSVRALGEYESQEAIRSFEEIGASALDQTLWSETRRNDYKASLEIDLGRPMALLLIPSLDLKVPIFDGADDANMNRGVGRIMGSACGLYTAARDSVVRAPGGRVGRMNVEVANPELKLGGFSAIRPVSLSQGRWSSQAR